MGLKRNFSLIILLTGLLLQPSVLEAQKVRRVVIDAGHGGHDSGAVGKNAKEKDIALSVALKTGKYIKENLKDVEVIYTRKTDVFVELYRRAKIANEAKADLFISIHCNANPSTSPYGSETYVMGLHKSQANLAVAQLENKAILLEDDYHVQYDGFDPSSPEGYIFFSMLQNAFLDQSLNLASMAQKHLKDKVNMYNRGVKQAGFLVLYKTTMPSVLIETGFISNLNDEKILISEDGQNKLALAIYSAVKEYKQSVEKTGTESHPIITENTVNTPETKNEETAVADKTEPQNSENTTNAASQEGITPVFKVQFLISKTMLEKDASQFRNLENVGWYQHQGIYKYTIGNEKSPEDAQKLLNEMVAKGFKDAFLVAFVNGERIPVEEARKMLKN
ncbi:MAG: N-acetylmuramoyl-L-alanine amidase [Bacteroidales bacterium]|nr:N-acetylmuramoyl-L-alanine amidase [Bacteroidales bacterium]